MKKVIILGGGLSGLAAAEQLAGAYKVIVLEKENLLGGLARSFNYKNVWIPLVYHHVSTADTKTIEYLKKYNLKDKLCWNAVNMAFWYNFKQYPLTKPWHILTFKPVSLLSRLNLIKLGVYTRLKQDFKSLKDLSAEEWLTKFAGKELVNKLFCELGEIKFGDLASIDAAWLAERLREVAKTREKYAYLSCGFQEMIERIANGIKSKGGVIKTNAVVTQIKKNTIKAIINGKQKTFKADKIISSLPPPTLAKISDIPNTIKDALTKINYKAVICMVLSTKKRFQKEYWNIFIEPKLSFGGIFDHSALYPKPMVEGEHIYYIFRYVSPAEKFYQLNEKRIEEEFMKDIQKLDAAVTPHWCKVFKIKESEAISNREYKNLPIRLTNCLYLTGVYMEYPCTRTMHSALASGIKTAKYILKEDKDENPVY